MNENLINTVLTYKEVRDMWMEDLAPNAEPDFRMLLKSALNTLANEGIVTAGTRTRELSVLSGEKFTLMASESSIINALELDGTPIMILDSTSMTQAGSSMYPGSVIDYGENEFGFRSYGMSGCLPQDPESSTPYRFQITTLLRPPVGDINSNDQWPDELAIWPNNLMALYAMLKSAWCIKRGEVNSSMDYRNSAMAELQAGMKRNRMGTFSANGFIKGAQPGIYNPM